MSPAAKTMHAEDGGEVAGRLRHWRLAALSLLVLVAVGSADATVYVDVHGGHASVYVLAALTVVAVGLAVTQLRLARGVLLPAVVAVPLLLVWIARAVAD